MNNEGEIEETEEPNRELDVEGDEDVEDEQVETVTDMNQ